MKKNEERLTKEMNEVQSQNRKLVEPLRIAKAEVEDLKRQLANYGKDKTSLAVSLKLRVYQNKFNNDKSIVILLYLNF